MDRINHKGTSKNSKSSFSLRTQRGIKEKAGMRALKSIGYPITLALSLRERGFLEVPISWLPTLRPTN
jgi:hypothetical protein